MIQNSAQNLFGYAEMYEWANIPKLTFGRFVQFSNGQDKHHCITLAVNPENIIGVTTANPAIKSDDPNEWFLKYVFNKYGALCFTQKEIAVGKKQYDDVNEFAYIKTQPQISYKAILSELYDDSKQYVKRSLRSEWVPVNLIGKCVVEDNGQCEAGTYCTLYNGDDEERYGTAIPATNNESHKWYVLNRVSDTTILILYK